MRGTEDAWRAPHPNPLPHNPLHLASQGGSWGRGSQKAWHRAEWREGFTLIELLVVIVILLIMATLAIAAYRGVTNADRVTAAARNFKTSLEGARSRAIADGQPRGIRLVLDPNIPHVVTSIVPIGASEYHEGVFTGVLEVTSTNRWQLEDSSLTLRRINDRALLQLGVRVEIPAFSGRWYPLVEAEMDDNYDGAVDPSEDLDGSGSWDAFVELASSDVIAIRGQLYLTSTADIPYRLQLAPPILPGAEPVIFPQGVGIDLNGCDLPAAWRPATTADFYSTSMDIMFASNGTLTGGLASNGLVHLYFADVEDIERSAEIRGDVPITGTDSPIVPASPQAADQLVSLFTQTGMSVVAEVNHTDSDLDGIADAPFIYATAGREAK